MADYLVSLAEVRLLPSVTSPDKRNVFIQEAAACERPIDVASLNARSEFSTIDDSEAFTWEHDVTALMRGLLDESFSWDDLVRRVQGRSPGARRSAPTPPPNCRACTGCSSRLARGCPVGWRVRGS